jgi:hypothetical protein
VISFSADRISCGEPLPCQASLSGVKVIMMFMRVLEMESLCQAATGWILALECLLSGTCGSQWLRLVLAGVKLPCRPMMPVSESYAQDQRLPGDAT